MVTPPTTDDEPTETDPSAGPHAHVTDGPGGTETGSGSGTTAAAVCGDGVVEGDEQCDDGNLELHDDCLPGCVDARCGDGVLWAGVEACDDGNLDDHDTCTSACQPAACGDGVVQLGESCDDGNLDDHDACTGSCELATCGDGHVWLPFEDCDTEGDTPTCDDDCTPAQCGDGHVNAAAGEQCDDDNKVPFDACTHECQHATCGDGLLWEGAEECDDGNLTPGDGCESDCTIPPKYAAYSPKHNLVPRSPPAVRCFRPSRPRDQGVWVFVLYAGGCAGTRDLAGFLIRGGNI